MLFGNVSIILFFLLYFSLYQSITIKLLLTMRIAKCSTCIKYQLKATWSCFWVRIFIKYVKCEMCAWILTTDTYPIDVSLIDWVLFDSENFLCNGNKHMMRIYGIAYLLTHQFLNLNSACVLWRYISYSGAV